MKKRLFLIAAVVMAVAVNSFAGEGFVGGGYDFYRHGTNDKLDGTSHYKTNPKLRAEWLPFEGEKGFKGGFGIAHDFGTKTKDGEKLGQATPVYGVWKPEWQIGDNSKFYNKYRLGWSFNTGQDGHKSGTYAVNSDYKSGPYAGAEIGVELGKFAVGLTHDMIYVPGRKGGKENKGTVNMQSGVQVGYVIGGERKVKPIPVVPKPAPAPTPAPEPVPAPVVERTVEQGRGIVHFQFDHPMVDTATGQAELNNVVETLNRMSEAEVKITGHTDSKGSDAYNQRLGQARAENVANEIQRRTDPNKVRITSVYGEGESNPVDTNETDAGRANNRRAEVDFRGIFENQN